MLKPLETSNQPLGQFDSLDADLSSFLGGEVCTLTSTSITSSDKAARDVFDGYSPGFGGTASAANSRPAVTFQLLAASKPLFLADEGTTNYGTLFGVVVGGSVGQQSTGGAVLGPHTALGSGKITCWHQHGLYAVSLDAVDTTHNTGLVPQNPALDCGDALYGKTSTGKLTPNSVGSTTAVVARFVEFQSNGSLVSTPASLLSTVNFSFFQAVIHYRPES